MQQTPPGSTPPHRSQKIMKNACLRAKFPNDFPSHLKSQFLNATNTVWKHPPHRSQKTMKNACLKAKFPNDLPSHSKSQFFDCNPPLKAAFDTFKSIHKFINFRIPIVNWENAVDQAGLIKWVHGWVGMKRTHVYLIAMSSAVAV